MEMPRQLSTSQLVLHMILGAASWSGKQLTRQMLPIIQAVAECSQAGYNARLMLLNAHTTSIGPSVVHMSRDDWCLQVPVAGQTGHTRLSRNIAADVSSQISGDKWQLLSKRLSGSCISKHHHHLLQTAVDRPVSLALATAAE